MEGRTIARRYRLGASLGHGGMASVWEAEDLELGRRVAVKVLGPEADPRRFEREARAVAALDHPSIVRVFDVGESDGRPFIVFELMPGGTLEDRLPAGRPLPDDETARIGRAVAEALSYAHARGIVHRDLKPANVLFDAEDRPKLTDFGVARVAGGGTTLTEAGSLVGTAAYISPEQALGEPVGPAGDVYSFGVILFRMLTGRLPFEADTPPALAAMHAQEPAPPVVALRPDASARLESLAAAALAKDPADRPPDGAALVAELRGTVAAAARSLRTRRRRRAPMAALAVAGALALATAGLFLALTAGGEGREEPVPTAATDTGPPAIETTAPGETSPAEPTTAQTTLPTEREDTTETQPTTGAQPTTDTQPTVPTTTEPAPTDTDG